MMKKLAAGFRVVTFFLNNIALKYKLLMFFVCVLFFFIFTISYFTYSKSSEFVKAETSENNLLQLAATAKNIEYTLKNYNRVLNSLYIDNPFIKLLSDGQHAYDNPIDFYKAKMNIYDHIYTMLLPYDYNPKFKIYLINSTLEPDQDIFFSQEQLTSNDWFEEYPVEIRNSLKWSKAYKQNVRGVESYWISSYMPIRDSNDGSILAIVRLEFKIESLFEILERMTVKGKSKFILANSEGVILYSSEQELVTGNANEFEYLRSALNGNNGYYQTDLPASNNTVFYHKNEGTGWTLINIVSFDEIVSKTGYIRNYTALIAALSLVLALIITILYVRIVTKRIQILSAAMVRVGKGDFEITTGISGSDEIGQMNHVFLRMVMRTKNLIAQVHETEKEKYLLELKALQEQIKPHLLYNTLSAVHSMAHGIEAHEISKAIFHLTDFYKLTLSKGMDIIPIANELRHTNNYIEIIKIRFNEKYQFVQQIDPEIYDFRTPKLILQPFVENAIFHGFDCVLDREPVIELKAEKTNDAIVFYISDNGKGMDQGKIAEIYGDRCEGYAIKNIDSRLQLYYGFPYGVTIISKPDSETVVTVKIPLLI
ncbi:sensor histidine kinase [Cohnella sp. LGH]|uniref:sensor histidine kinase n=1 Tax=Cohnella sp. LGH TaxID=1619153 RepID=UPI001AD98701|nr:sensor histidine kinase [Cohnella sp. LGH]QTH45313.1 sensor histidine kinase [Cohnella sp. LGH]